ncbi:branched-subunit amino acid aminotransferase/4-amino-4-deoxychorismate lyase [Kribbella sp. VKM Ac-2571]|uniref:aminotransferase class IV n=1 Tax=Kribbella sp. VKM Ac-2571 TaxID=2512222 RepID=UPI0010EC57A3|nr:aminotransferase class IV [Kribbella sp. VKM Ac-2571]TDO67382.1 branched-subunit amino acid aminotransferase/4-amino-4-deoxychorismate lyase [Kribbella sp. VKM Ac-2571]
MSDFLLLDGALLPTIDPRLLRATSYGHFTSMQVRDGRVDGLDLHFERLDRSTREVFGRPLPEGRVRADLRAALDQAGSGDLSIRVNVFADDELHLLTRVGPPVAPGTQPLRLLAYQHERAVPHLKHTGTFDLTYYARAAKQAGYDDAVFHTATGELSEASIWNICFARGPHLVFPTAPTLPGIRQQVLQRGLESFDTAPIPLADLPTYDAAYLTNSIDPALPVASITTATGTTTYAPHHPSATTITKAYASLSGQPI